MFRGWSIQRRISYEIHQATLGLPLLPLPGNNLQLRRHNPTPKHWHRHALPYPILRERMLPHHRRAWDPRLGETYKTRIWVACGGCEWRGGCAADFGSFGKWLCVFLFLRFLLLVFAICLTLRGEY